MTTTTPVYRWTSYDPSMPIGNFRRGVVRPTSRDYAVPNRIRKLPEPVQDLYVDIRQQINDDQIGHMDDDYCPYCGEAVARHHMLPDGVRVLAVRSGTRLFDRYRFIFDPRHYDFETVHSYFGIGERVTHGSCTTHGKVAVWPILYEDDDLAAYDLDSIGG